MSAPRVLVVRPVYNGTEFVARAATLLAAWLPDLRAQLEQSVN